MNKDQLKTAFAKGARIQAWRLNEGAVSSMDGFWDTFRHEPAFTCPLHLYRVHPEDLSLIAELGQEVGAVASRPLHKVEPSDDEPQFRTLSNEVAPQVYFYRLGWNQCRDAMLLTSPAHTSEARDASGLVAAAKRLDKFSLVILSSVAVEDPEFSERVGAALVDLRNAAHADPCAVKYRKALERIFDCGRFPEGHHSAGDHEFCGSHHADCIAIAREALSEDAAMRQEGGNG